jgi:hypothetical protein
MRGYIIDINQRYVIDGGRLKVIKVCVYRLAISSCNNIL